MIRLYFNCDKCKYRSMCRFHITQKQVNDELAKNPLTNETFGNEPILKMNIRCGQYEKLEK